MRVKVSLIAMIVGLSLIGTELSYASYASYEEWKDERDYLNIGIPDAPGRVRKTLPEPREDAGFDVGPVTLFPTYRQKIEFDDNIRLAKNNKEEDVIFTQRPSLEAAVEFGDHRISGGYGMEIVEFAKNGEESAVNHLAHGLLELNFNNLQIIVEDSFEKSTGRSFNETSVRDTLLLNTVQVFGRYDQEKWAGEIGWTHNTIDHKSTPALDRNDYEEDILTVLGGYKLTSKLLALIETDIGWVYYDTNEVNSNQTYWQSFGGVRGNISDDIEVLAKIGYQYRSTGDVIGEAEKADYSGLVADGSIVYRASERDVYEARYNRTVRTSTFQLNSWYRRDQISLSYRKRFGEKWFLTPVVSWQMNDYPEESVIALENRERFDHFWLASLALQYKLRDWVWLGLKYNFKHRNSNYDTFDYSNNQVIFDVTLTA